MQQIRVGPNIYTRASNKDAWEKKDIPLGRPAREGVSGLASINAAKKANRGNMTPCVHSFRDLPKVQA